MATEAGLFLNGEFVGTHQRFTVRHKYRGEVLAEVAEAGENEVAAAVQGARSALARPLTIPQRFEILTAAAQALHRREAEFARLIAQEAGKPYKDALAEVRRARETLTFSAIAAKTLAGEEVPVAANPGSESRLAFTVRKPYGVVLAITPFNFPLNLALHKVGPALAGGNAVILKPAPATPLTALRIAELFAEAGLPPGWLQVLTSSGAQLGQRLVADPGVDLISFTGSAQVGQQIRQQAGLRPVLLELGNNSANIVHSDADIAAAAAALAQRAYAYAGQVCIAVQRIYVHRPVYERFVQLMADYAGKMKVGDPEREDTDIGPMIHPDAAARAESWAQEAVGQGAELVLGAKREGAILPPILLAGVGPGMRVVDEEAFAPIAGVSPYDDFGEALRWVNASRYGLQAGVFTHSVELAMQAVRALAVGGVIINDTSAYRADNMPYGGVKASGVGREGPHYAVREMTYSTVAVFNLPGQ
ncbi:MAG: aldehyde dehydrogenase family protein [Firmicutes bacterium]|nr:aldehyde dehydrogenase family protein [Bacillota bacterium]